VRVIAGTARGRTLKGPPRVHASGRPGIRPTSDLIRGVIFDMLDALGADYGRVLDLYAGTGALGIEALSRGDGTADFVDNDADAVATVRANLQLTGFESRGTVHRIPAEHATSRLEGPYTLVLLDPPYYDVDAFDAAEAVASSGLVDGESVVVVEHQRKVEARPTIGALPLYRSRRHGDSVVSIYAEEETT
jgi:16S rRNA (guanine(966)-N(2))-methyltransferase RsmD